MRGDKQLGLGAARSGEDPHPSGGHLRLGCEPPKRLDEVLERDSLEPAGQPGLVEVRDRKSRNAAGGEQRCLARADPQGAFRPTPQDHAWRASPAGRCVIDAVEAGSGDRLGVNRDSGTVQHLLDPRRGQLPPAAVDGQRRHRDSVSRAGDTGDMPLGPEQSHRRHAAVAPRRRRLRGEVDHAGAVGRERRASGADGRTALNPH